MRYLKKALKIILGLLLTLLLVVLAVAGYLYWELGTGRLSERFRSVLAESLGTEVLLDDCRLHVFEQELSIHQLTVKDHQHKDMLHIDTLEVQVDLLQLLHHHFVVHDFELYGAHANIYRIAGTKQFNTQFATDSLRALSLRKEKKEKHHKLYIDLHECQILRSSVHYEMADVLLDSIFIKPQGDGLTHLSVNKVHIHTDNHKPRRNKVNPHRGAFDAGHVDVDLSFKASSSYLTSDSVAMTIDELRLYDKPSQLEVSSLTMGLQLAGGHCHGTNLRLTSHQTIVTIPRFELVLPSKVMERKFYLEAPKFEAHTVLRDISTPFVPKLKNFTTPLNVTSGLVFSDKRMRFSHITIASQRHDLRLKADGVVWFKGRRPNGKRDIDCRFTVHSMQAQNDIKNRIIGHFASLPPSLVNMLTHVGNIRFRGSLHIPYKHPYIKGLLTTEVGDLRTAFDFRKSDHRLKGTVSTDSISLSTLTGNKNLGKLAFNADFNFVLARKNQRLANGKKALPKGYLEGVASEASYKFIHIHNINFRIDCDGQKGAGQLTSVHRIIDYGATFTFDGLDIKHTLKVKPRVKMHNLLENTFLKKIFKRRYRKRMEKKAREAQENKS